MANEITNTQNILVEFAEQNIVLVDPNKIISADGQPRDRAVRHEELTIYVNLKARVVPRSKVIGGAGVETEAIVDIFEGDINFTKPGDKDYMTTDWSDVFTGGGDENGPFNQKQNTVKKDPVTGKEYTKETIKNKRDAESFGIENIQISLNSAYIPTVIINFVDVRGKTLFEQGENSPYAAFFQLPYPMFILTIKGYFGKAVQFKLMMHKFNANFDPGSGNYNVTCSFIGRLSAILADITVQEIMNSPYMYPRQYEINSEDEGVKRITTSRGAQVQHEVYNIYRRKGLVAPDFKDITLKELVNKIKTLEASIEQALSSHNLNALDDIDSYRTFLDQFTTRILGSVSWRTRYLDMSNQGIFVDRATNIIYYTWKKEVGENENKKQEAIDSLKSYIKQGTEGLLKNNTFGEGKEEFIAVDIKYEYFVATPVVGMPEVLGGESNWFIFKGMPNSFETKIGEVQTKFNQKKVKIESNLSNIINGVVRGSEGLGFNPTIRNLYAVIMAGADTFLRLMNEVHLKSMDMRDNDDRLNALKGTGAPDTQLQKDEFVYPWPAYYLRKDNESGGQNFISTYPGASSVIAETKAYLPDVWPEVEFVEEYLRSMTVRDNFPVISGTDSRIGENWVPVTSADFLLNILYADTSYVPFYYEIWDRSTLHSFYSGIYTRFMSDKGDAALQAMALVETANIKTKSAGSFDLQEQLKNQQLDYNTFYNSSYGGSEQSFLQSLAPLTKWQLLIRDEVNTQYIRDMINTGRCSIHPFIDLLSVNYGNEQTPTDDAIVKLKDFLSLAKEENGKIILDTFPFMDLSSSSGINSASTPWVKRNLANGENIQSFQDLYTISNSISVSDNIRNFTSQIKTEKQLSSFGAAPFYSDPKPILTNSLEIYDNMLVTRYETIIDKRESWAAFYSKASQKQSQILSSNHLLLTEGELSYTNKESKLTPNKKQITSILNTPYFTNAFREGVLNDMTGVPNPYTNAAYLFLNSLPLASLRDKTLLDVEDNVALHGDYVFTTLNQVSALHPLPYAWILKYGSIWNRYKTYIDTGIDSLSSVWNDYNAGQGFNPASNSLSNLYNLDVGPNNTTINFFGETNIGAFTKINLGFYPELVNLTHYFVTGTLLFNNTTITSVPVTSTEINNYIVAGALNVKKNNDISITPPTNNTGQDVGVDFWNAYYDTTHDILTSGYTEPSYILYPSSGGLKKSQLKFEINDEDYAGNPNTHNGNTRFLWPMSQYGYFATDITTLPDPWEYLDKVDPTTVMQSPFKIKNDSTYNTIEELFDIFSPDILDKFEEYFLNFSKNETSFSSILDGLEYFSDDNNSNSLSSSNLATTNGMTLQSVIRELLIIPQYTVTSANNDSDFGTNLAKAQNQKITTTLTNFLSKRITFNFYNQNDINIQALRTLVGQGEYYNFGKYTNNLPPDVSLAISKSSAPTEWATLYKEIGFIKDPLLPTLDYNDYGSEITDFFKDMDIEFTVNNIKVLRKVIRMYVTERVRADQSSTTISSILSNLNITPPNPAPAGFVTTFKGKLLELVDGLDDAQSVHVNELFLKCRELFDKVPVRAQIDDIEPVFQTDEQKLELYQTFKTLNDKWIAGEEFGERTLFEDFLFFDRANRDIGDKAIIDVEDFKLLDSEANATTTLLGFIGIVLRRNNFYFLPLPSYINFYGVSDIDENEVSKYSTSDEANALFGTHLEVDYLASAPKFLCMYVGEPSQHVNVQSDIYRYDTDSFLLGRTSDNPLFSRCSDPTKCNKVVAFNVDFGTQNQGIFKGVSLDQNEYRNTAETFRLTQSLADSSNDKTISTQGLNLFNIYRSRSYTAKVTSMGNACIQPTMYFNLRYVPMFSGPYLITDVEHNISPNNMETTFTGIRSPFFDLPDIEDIIAKVNKSFIERVKDKTVTNVQLGGFSAEGAEKDLNKTPAAKSMGASVTRLIIHSTGNIDLGNNPITALNTAHKDAGFAGIGFHYVIGRDGKGTVLRGRPDTYEGAHTLDANTDSISTAIISNCDSGTNNYSNTNGELSTAKQNSALERLLILELFQYEIVRVVKNTNNSIILAIVGPSNSSMSWPKEIPTPYNGIDGSTYKEIIKGHNDYSPNKKCPCFKVENALGGVLKNKLNDNLKLVWPVVLGLANENISNNGSWKAKDELSYLKPQLIIDKIRSKLGLVIKNNLLPADNFLGKPTSHDSGSSTPPQIVSPELNPDNIPTYLLAPPNNDYEYIPDPNAYVAVADSTYVYVPPYIP